MLKMTLHGAYSEDESVLAGHTWGRGLSSFIPGPSAPWKLHQEFPLVEKFPLLLDQNIPMVIVCHFSNI
jgi:hypothetical protein